VRVDDCRLFAPLQVDALCDAKSMRQALQSHDRTAWSVVYTLDRQTVVFPSLDSPQTISEMIGNLFPAGQNHGVSILAQPWHVVWVNGLGKTQVPWDDLGSRSRGLILVPTRR
jgi:hypothetical protein